MAERFFEEEESKAYDIPKMPTQIIFVFLSGFKNTAMRHWGHNFGEPPRPCTHLDFVLDRSSADMGMSVYCAKVIEVFVVLTQIIVLPAFNLKRTRPCPQW